MHLGPDVQCGDTFAGPGTVDDEKTVFNCGGSFASTGVRLELTSSGTLAINEVQVLQQGKVILIDKPKDLGAVFVIHISIN
jgi:hypothetical protein